MPDRKLIPWLLRMVGIIYNTDSTFNELIAVSDNGKPMYYTLYNVSASKSTRVNHLHTGGSLGLDLNGENMVVHVWDGGPTRPSHQEFDGAGGTNRVIINDGNTTLNYNSFHAQHVTGTIVASGYVASAKGMAPYAKALTHDWYNDLSEATIEASKGMLISNHSYSKSAYKIDDWQFGAYENKAIDWDNLMYNAPYYLMVVAAGNEGDNDTSNVMPLDGNTSYDKLNGHTTCKNNMVVASCDLMVYCTSGADSDPGHSNFMYIDKVRIGNYENASGDNSGYKMFRDQSVDLETGSTYDISLCPGFGTGNLFGEYWHIYIDLNRNGSFADAGELIYDPGNSSGSCINGIITIPSSAPAGKTMMRVSMQYQTGAGPCETFMHGEVEDYEINISAPGDN